MIEQSGSILRQISVLRHRRDCLGGKDHDRVRKGRSGQKHHLHRCGCWVGIPGRPGFDSGDGQWFPRIGISLSVEDAAVYDLADVLESRCEIGDALLRHNRYGMELLCAPLDPSYVPREEQLRTLVLWADRNYDWLLTDCGAGFGPWRPCWQNVRSGAYRDHTRACGGALRRTGVRAPASRRSGISSVWSSTGSPRHLKRANTSVTWTTLSTWWERSCWELSPKRRSWGCPARISCLFPPTRSWTALPAA